MLLDSDILPTLLRTAALALVLDALLGDPDWLWRRLPHPIRMVGWAVAALDRRLNRESLVVRQRRIHGMAALAILVTGSFVAGWAIMHAARTLAGGWAVEAVLLAVLLAQRSLYDHVKAVQKGLHAEGLAGGRRAVAHIVGRDPEQLDEAGICRAALESLAENQSDGVTAPLFWYLLLGLPGVLAYKALNTADSMIGHRTPRYGDFGWAAARLDDLVNLVPARATAIAITLSALFLPVSRAGAGAATALRAAMRDAPLHRSPNAGWPEAALAGALGLALAGPRSYGGAPVEDAWMNREGSRDARADDIGRGLALYLISTALLWAAVGLALAIAT